MPNAVVVRSKTSITNPLPNTPRLPNIDAGILFDWDPETLNLANGAAVTSLPSKRGTLGRAGDLSVVTSGTVTLVTEAGRKKSLLMGAGSLATQNFATPIPAPLTIAVVARAADPTHATRYVVSGGPGGYAGITFKGIGFGSPNQLTFGATAPADKDVALVGVFDGATSKTQLNGKNETTGNTGGNGSAQAIRFIIGTNTSAAASANLVGRIQRVIAYNRALSATELRLLNQYLSAEYALGA